MFILYYHIPYYTYMAWKVHVFNTGMPFLLYCNIAIPILYRSRYRNRYSSVHVYSSTGIALELVIPTEEVAPRARPRFNWSFLPRRADQKQQKYNIQYSIFFYSVVLYR